MYFIAAHITLEGCVCVRERGGRDRVTDRETKTEREERETETEKTETEGQSR